MKRLLSTRLLSPSQKALLPEGIEYMEYDAIRITLLPVTLRDTGARYAVFTSRNAVRACFGGIQEPTADASSESDIPTEENFQTPGCFCVGEKTAALLEEHGQKVLEVADKAADLAIVLKEKYNDQSFIHFCGNLRLQELSRSMTEAEIPWEEHMVYRTDLQERAFEEDFDAVLFFSPSGVESFVRKNSLLGATAVCIGNTTARAASRHTRQIIIAGKPAVEQVLLAAQSALV